MPSVRRLQPGPACAMRRGPAIRRMAAGYGVLKALDPQTGALKWEYKMNDVTASGVLTTATDIVFTGSREGFFPRARRPHRKTAVARERRRRNRHGPHHLSGERQTVRGL